MLLTVYGDKIKKYQSVFLIFYISFAFICIFIGSAVVLTTSNNLQPAFSQGYIPPPYNINNSKWPTSQ